METGILFKWPERNKSKGRQTETRVNAHDCGHEKGQQMMEDSSEEASPGQSGRTRQMTKNKKKTRIGAAKLEQV